MTDVAFFSGLLPDVATLARVHRARCAGHGLSIVFTSGWRSPREQMDLYAKGREWRVERGWVVSDQRLVVTNATPEHAPHCRGAAYDCAPLVNEKIDWTRLDLFAAVAQLAPAPLVWGGSWPKLKDMPHFELPSWRALPLKNA